MVTIVIFRVGIYEDCSDFIDEFVSSSKLDCYWKSNRDSFYCEISQQCTFVIFHMRLELGTFSVVYERLIIRQLLMCNFNRFMILSEVDNWSQLFIGSLGNPT